MTSIPHVASLPEAFRFKPTADTEAAIAAKRAERAAEIERSRIEENEVCLKLHGITMEESTRQFFQAINRPNRAGETRSTSLGTSYMAEQGEVMLNRLGEAMAWANYARASLASNAEVKIAEEFGGERSAKVAANLRDSWARTAAVALESIEVMQRSIREHFTVAGELVDKDASGYMGFGSFTLLRTGGDGQVRIGSADGVQVKLGDGDWTTPRGMRDTHHPDSTYLPYHKSLPVTERVA